MALVEFAIIMPLLFLLLLGIIDFGFAFGDYIGVRNGAREGARLAVVNPSGTNTCSTATATPNAATLNLVCLTKDRVDLTEADVRVGIAFEDSTPVAGESVKICVSYPAVSRSGMTAPFLSGRTIKSETEMRLETGPTYSAFSEGGLTC